MSAVERLCGVSPGLKWPNDPVLDGKKLCGILTELSLEGETARVQELVLGIGINVSQRPEDFTPEVREIATSLVQALATLCPGPPWRRRSSGRWTASAQPWRQERLVLIWPSTGGGA